MLSSLTKPDLVDEGGEHHVIDLVKGKRNKLKLGYCIVCNRSQKELDTDSVSRGDKERDFFNTEPWSSLSKDRVGVDALKSRLRDLLTEIVKREFPKIKSQIEHRLTHCKKQHWLGWAQTVKPLSSRDTISRALRRNLRPWRRTH